MTTAVVLVGLLVIAVLLYEIRLALQGLRLSVQSVNEAVDGSNPLFSRAALAKHAREVQRRRAAVEKREAELTNGDLWNSEKRKRPCAVSPELRYKMEEIAREVLSVDEGDRLLSLMLQPNLDVRNGRETVVSGHERFNRECRCSMSSRAAWKAFTEDWEARAFGADVAHLVSEEMHE